MFECVSLHDLNDINKLYLLYQLDFKIGTDNYLIKNKMVWDTLAYALIQTNVKDMLTIRIVKTGIKQRYF